MCIRDRDNYGTDRPDTRYQMLLKDLGGVLGAIGFNIFTKAIKSGGSIKAITVKGGNLSISNVRIKPGGDIFQVAQDAGAGGLAFIRVKGDELETIGAIKNNLSCLLYTSPSPRDATLSRMPSSA